MNESLVDKIAQAVLYEGYILYPYRPSVKNRQRWTFGGVYPRAYSEARPGSDAWWMQTQCLVVGSIRTLLAVKVRFLHLTERTAGELSPPLPDWPAGLEPPYRAAESIQVGGKRYDSWQEAAEREISLSEVSLGELLGQARQHPFAFEARREVEPLRDDRGRNAGVLVRQQQRVEGSVELSAEPRGDELFELTVKIVNLTPLEDGAAADRDAALLRSLASTHSILIVRDGRFISSIDPPAQFKAAAGACRNVGAFPVLVGDTGQADTMLSSPIILYDYPQIAPESPGDLFDATEIDEILTLRILTLTDDEKQAAAAVDERARALLARTESLARAQLAGLHGAVRGLRPISEEQPHA